jgi:hypothetical protein
MAGAMIAMVAMISTLFSNRNVDWYLRRTTGWSQREETERVTIYDCQQGRVGEDASNEKTEHMNKESQGAMSQHGWVVDRPPLRLAMGNERRWFRFLTPTTLEMASQEAMTQGQFIGFPEFRNQPLM